MSEMHATKPVRGREVRTGHTLVVATTRRPVIQIEDGGDGMIRLRHGGHDYTDVGPDMLVRVLDRGSRVEVRSEAPPDDVESSGSHLWFISADRRGRRRTA
jgi:hypothetical protein